MHSEYMPTDQARRWPMQHDNIAASQHADLSQIVLRVGLPVDSDPAGDAPAPDSERLPLARLPLAAASNTVSKCLPCSLSWYWPQSGEQRSIHSQWEA